MSNRVIVVGDLHGCRTELDELLARLAPDENDRVACVGDFVTKGPDGIACLELWRERAWLGVRGNNDDEVLRLLWRERSTAKDYVAEEARRLEVRPELVEYLASLPLLVDLPDISACVVHGGLLPAMRVAAMGELERHAGVLLNARMIVERDGVWRLAPGRNEREGGIFWADVWNGDRFVLYGHAAGPEPRRSPRALGIDTGCVYGGRLTAAVFESGEWTTVSVASQRAYARRGLAAGENGE